VGWSPLTVLLLILGGWVAASLLIAWALGRLFRWLREPERGEARPVPPVSAYIRPSSEQPNTVSAQKASTNVRRRRVVDRSKLNGGAGHR